MTDKTPEEQAVIDAAETLEAGFVEYTNLPATGWNDDDKLLKLVEAVRQSVEALRASRKPKGVKPEDVPVGDLFEFAPGVTARPLGCVAVMMDHFNRSGDTERAFRWFEDGTRAFLFSPEDLIIHIQEEE